VNTTTTTLLRKYWTNWFCRTVAYGANVGDEGSSGFVE
jgi:hypothetical protein